MQTIMEHKIKVLVQSVMQTAAAVVNSPSAAGNPAGQALAKDVAALQKLVNASIAALRNAANSSPASAASSSAGSATVSSIGTGQGSFSNSGITSGAFSAHNVGPTNNGAILRASYPSAVNPMSGENASNPTTVTADPFSYRNLLSGGGVSMTSGGFTSQK